MLRRFVGRALLVCGGILAAFIAGETAARVGYWMVRGQRFAADEYRTAMTERLTAPDAPVNGSAPGEYSVGTGVHEVLHPYLGYVPDPASLPGHETIGDVGQVLPRSDGTRIVGVFGGSFAAGLCAYGGRELRRVLALPAQKVRLLCLAAGGYKQPQQLLALTYLLAQGAHFDLVITVDGFNEIALPPLENLPQRVAPLYPRAWFWRVGNLTDPGGLKLLGELSALDRRRTAWADTSVAWQLYRSALLAVLWEQRDRLFEVERGTLLAEIRAHKVEQRTSYAATGPTMTFADDDALYGYLARVWRNSALQMKLLCDANHIAYAHFLQPNQHVAGAKQLAPEELRLGSGGPYHRQVVRGYPLLQQYGEELRSTGVRFHDLTMIFKDVQDPVFSDGCCHLTPGGYELVARAIGDAIAGDGGGETARAGNGSSTP